MIVAITGRSGCGKTEVAKHFNNKGFLVIDADKIANLVLTENADVKQKLIDEFGNDILDANGSLDKKAIANIAFLDKESAKKLTDITHPAIVDNILHIAKAQNDQLVFVDGAVIVNELFEKYCDKIIVVTALRADAISRIVLRDGISRIAAENRIKAQCEESVLREKADFIIENISGKEQLVTQADQVLSSVIKIFEERKVF